MFRYATTVGDDPYKKHEKAAYVRLDNDIPVAVLIEAAHAFAAKHAVPLEKVTVSGGDDWIEIFARVPETDEEFAKRIEHHDYMENVKRLGQLEEFEKWCQLTAKFGSMPEARIIEIAKLLDKAKAEGEAYRCEDRRRKAVEARNARNSART